MEKYEVPSEVIHAAIDCLRKNNLGELVYIQRANKHEDSNNYMMIFVSNDGKYNYCTNWNQFDKIVSYIYGIDEIEWCYRILNEAYKFNNKNYVVAIRRGSTRRVI